MHIRLSFLVVILLFFLLLLPQVSLAQDSGLIPCNGPDCDFDDLVQLGINVVDFLVGFGILLAVIGFIFAGFKILTAGPNASQVSEGKQLLQKVAIGFFFVIAAWLIVNTITSVLFQTGFSLLGD